MKNSPRCNARKNGWAKRVDAIPPGPHGGDGYCGRPAGWGFQKEGIAAPERKTMRCRQHGGGHLIAGPDHPSYIHGGRSKYAIEYSPAAVQRMVAELSQENPELLSRAPEINVVSARVYLCLQRARDEDPEPGVLRERLLAVMALAVESGSAKVVKAIERLDDEARRAQYAESWWVRAMKAIETQSRLQKDEEGYMIERGRYVRLERLAAAADHLADAVRQAVDKHVEDATVRQAIQDEVANFMLQKAEEIAA